MKRLQMLMVLFSLAGCASTQGQQEAVSNYDNSYDDDQGVSNNLANANANANASDNEAEQNDYQYNDQSNYGDDGNYQQAADDFIESPTQNETAGGTQATSLEDIADDNLANALLEESPAADNPAGASANAAPVAVNPVSTNESLPQQDASTNQGPNNPEALGGPMEADVQPLLATLWWVGYDYNKFDRIVKVQMLTKGQPEFDIFQEQNRSQQPELVVRFYGTELRPKVRRAIDASEFHSPVAYIRMRPNPSFNYVDVVLTLRESASPRLLSKRGNVQLTFDLGDTYLFAGTPGQTPAYTAETLAPVEITPTIEPGSEQPRTTKISRVYVPDPTRGVFGREAQQAGQPIQPKSAQQVPANGVDPKGLPVSDFGSDQPEVTEMMNIENTEPESAPDEASEPAKVLEPQSPPPSLDSGAVEVQSFGFISVAQDGYDYDDEVEGPVAGDGALNANYNETPASGDAKAESFAIEDLQPTQLEQQNDVVGIENESVEKTYSGRPVVLEFFEAPLSEVLKAFSDQIGTNFIYPPSLGAQRITIKLKNVPWDAALNAILETYSLGMTKVAENIIRINPIAEMNRYIEMREQADLAKKLAEKKKILVVRVSNAQASALMQQLNTFFDTANFSNAVRMQADARTNSLYIEAPPYILSKAKSLLQRLDVPIPQVEVVSRLIEVRRQASNFLGISWAGGYNFDSNAGLGFGNLNFPNNANSSFSVDPGVASSAGVGTFNFNVGSINDFLDLTLRLRMEESKGTTEILQSSRVVVNNGQPAAITAGSSAYFHTFQSPQAETAANQGNTDQVTSQGSSGGPTPVTFNLNLTVTPTVTNEGRINMLINLSSAAPNPASIAGSAVTASTRSINTQLEKASGQTAVIGGIYDTKKSKQVLGIPLLSSLPIIGALFRSEGYTEDQTELMMMITPSILGRDGEKVLQEAAEPVYEVSEEQFNLNAQGGSNSAPQGNYENNQYEQNYNENTYENGGNASQNSGQTDDNSDNLGQNVNYGTNDYDNQYANGNY